MRRLGMITTVVVLASFAVVVAKSSYNTTFNNLYGTAGKMLDTYSNIAAINAGTFTGNPDSSLPVEASTWGKIKALFD